MEMRFFCLLFSALTLISCNNISEQDLTIIDKIVLGVPEPIFDKNIDTLSIQRERFLTKFVVSTLQDLNDQSNYINMYYTSIFDFSDYKTKFINNLGLHYPIYLEGTENNIGLLVLLGFAQKPYLQGEAAEYSSELPTRAFIQDVNAGIIEKVKVLYTSKYGKPSSEFTHNINSFYQIQNNFINKVSDTTRTGTEITWETKHLNITLFTGLPSTETTYKYPGYSIVLRKFHNDNSPLKVFPEDNQLQCFSYAYIKYEINNETIKQLKLDKTNL